jgi:hypothetical protein
MARALRVSAIVVGVLFGIGILTIFAARFHSGPIGPLPGGPFAEASSQGHLDAGSLAGLDTVEIEVGVGDPRTRTTWVVVHEGRIYVPAGAGESKLWPAQAEKDGRLRLRADGAVHEVSARRIFDEATRRAVLEAVGRKYEIEADPESDLVKGTWLFELGAPSTGNPPDAS